MCARFEFAAARLHLDLQRDEFVEGQALTRDFRVSHFLGKVQPVHGIRAEVTGAVTRPAVYELRTGETLTDLLRAAGGFAPNAQMKRVTVHRILGAGQRGP